VLNGKLDFNQTQPDAVHLSNLETDPGEKTNLADKHPSLVEELTTAVQGWFAELRSD